MDLSIDAVILSGAQSAESKDLLFGILVYAMIFADIRLDAINLHRKSLFRD